MSGYHYGENGDYYQNRTKNVKFHNQEGHKPIRYEHKDSKDELRKLKDLVQRRLFYLQNPKNCTAARKVVCSPTKNGFGSNLHQLTFCLIVAYATERTFVLESKGWRYDDKVWETFFLPVSSNCTPSLNDTKSAAKVHDLYKSKDDQAIYLPNMQQLSPIPDFMPFAIPEDIADRLERVHVNPEIWWIGQFVEYLIRPNRDLKLHLRRQQDKLSFKRPIVGLHVRRTDKIIEADYFRLEAYMEEVDNLFNQHMVNKTQERYVFIATDSPHVIQEAEKKYPRYIFVYHKVAATNKNPRSRYTPTSLKEMLTDVHTLAMCDYVICTMSSNVCRLVHELKESRDSTAFERTISLDSGYFFNQNFPGRQIAKWVLQNGTDGRDMKSFSIVKDKRRNSVRPLFTMDRPRSRVAMPVYTDVFKLS